MTQRSVAVITGDIISSMKTEYNRMLPTLKKSLAEALKDSNGSIYEVIRGDSFQIFLPDCSKALSKALLIRALLREHSQAEHSQPVLDARLSIGISEREGLELHSSLGESSGEAFLRSGRQLDQLKSMRQNIAISSGQDLSDAWMNLCLLLAEPSISSWTATQAVVVKKIIASLTQQQIATELNITQAAVSSRLKGAGWLGVRALLQRFETVYHSI